MVTQTYRCNTCRKEAQYPQDWLSVRPVHLVEPGLPRTALFRDTTERHFCQESCLVSFYSPIPATLPK
jgi:hypothetical protein